jgi:hypothetical protein
MRALAAGALFAVVWLLACSGPAARRPEGGRDNIPEVLLVEQREREARQRAAAETASDATCARIVPPLPGPDEAPGLLPMDHEPGGPAPATRDVVPADALLVPVAATVEVGRVAADAEGWPSPFPWAIPWLIPYVSERKDMPSWARLDDRNRLLVNPPPDLVGAVVQVELAGRGGAPVRRLLAFGAAGNANLVRFRDALTRVAGVRWLGGGTGSVPCRREHELAALVGSDVDHDGTPELVGYLSVHCSTPGGEDETVGLGLLAVVWPGPAPRVAVIEVAVSEAIFFPAVLRVAPAMNGGRPGLAGRRETGDGVWAALWTLEPEGFRKVADVLRPDHPPVCLVPSATRDASLRVDEPGGPLRIKRGGVSPGPAGP